MDLQPMELVQNRKRSSLDSETEPKPKKLHRGPINNLFESAIYSQDIESLDRCLSDGYPLLLTDAIVAVLLERCLLKSVRWIRKNSNNIILACNLEKIISDSNSITNVIYTDQNYKCIGLTHYLESQINKTIYTQCNYHRWGCAICGIQSLKFVQPERFWTDKIDDHGLNLIVCSQCTEVSQRSIHYRECLI